MTDSTARVTDRRAPAYLGAARDAALPPIPLGWRLAVLVGVYFVAGKLGLRLAFEHASATAVWPPTGIALAAMLLYGYRMWPAIFVGAFLVNIATAGSVWTSLGVATGNTLEGLQGVWPFVLGSQNESLLVLQTFIATLTIMSLPLAAVVREHARSVAALARTAAIVASSDDAILGKTLDGVITTWNEGAERLYGYAASEVIGRPISIIIPHEMDEELPRILAQLRRGERVDNYETVRVAKDGRCIDVSVTVSPILDERRRIVGASSIARDITHQREIEETARERDTLRSVASLAAGAAHEINNPLAVVMGQAQLLIDDIA